MTDVGSPLGRLWRARPAVLAAGVWAAGFGAAAWLDGRADSGSQAMPLLLAAAAASLWWPTWAMALACVAATLAFNWWFVVPRGSFNVAAPRDGVLLATLLGVSLGVTLLVRRQRSLAMSERRQGLQLAQLQSVGEALRRADGEVAFAPILQAALEQVALPGAVVWLGQADPAWATLSPDEQQGLALCQRESRALGPLTGRFDHQAAWFLPLRAHRACPGAVWIPLETGAPRDAFLLQHAQALADLVGQALERFRAQGEAEQAQAQARDQQLRNTLLAAVSHDYRTPLANILGAATSLRDQADRLPAAQQQRLADRIAREVIQLSRITDNALQLARLEGSTVRLPMAWESPEELIGAVLARVRARDPQHCVRARLRRPLPLLRCDGVLVVQLLENLIDNALHFSPPGEPVEVLVRVVPDWLLLNVVDRGPGVAPEDRQRIFNAFERSLSPASGRRGAGLGLALCRAVVQAHGGQLAVRERRRRGARFEVRLPLQEVPARPTELEE